MTPAANLERMAKAYINDDMDDDAWSRLSESQRDYVLSGMRAALSAIEVTDAMRAAGARAWYEDLVNDAAAETNDAERCFQAMIKAMLAEG